MISEMGVESEFIDIEIYRTLANSSNVKALRDQHEKHSPQIDVDYGHPLVLAVMFS